MSVKTVQKYFLVTGIIIRNSFCKMFAYRADFFSGLITDFCSNISKVILVNVLFLNVDSLGGWNQAQFLVLFGSAFLAESIYMFFFFNSHTTISRQIISGDMDFLLTKPMPEMFMLSVMNVNIGSGLSNFILGVIFVMKGVESLKIKVSCIDVLLYILFIAFGAMIYFAISFMINLLSFWFSNVRNVFEIYTNISDLYRYPGDIFPRVVSSCITFVIPLQLIAIIPAKYLMNGVPVETLALEAVYSAVLMLISYKVMRRAVAAYTSTGS